MNTTNDDTHTCILERYFFAFIDCRVGADETPLYTRRYRSEPLTTVIAREFGLTPEQADAAIEAARQEVWL